MPTIKVDGIECTYDADAKPSLLQVALDNGVEIPHYCYHPGMSVVASCRICLAEVAQPNPRNEGKVELIPKLVPTCQTPAVDGAEVYIRSPKSIANQKAVMEYLLINHPLDCPVCDKAGQCSLQDYSYNYGRSSSRFQEQKIKQPKKDIGTHVLLYSDRCIMCTRCVRFTREVTGTNELGVFGRGALEQIDVFPGDGLTNELSGNVVDICPVGALLDKDFLMTMRVWNLKQTPSVDGITASGDNLHIESNEGRVYRFKPRTNMEINQWWTSDEIRYGWKFVHDEHRLRSPLTRRNGVLQEADWNTAYEAVQGGLDGKRVGLMLSPMLPSEEAYALAEAVRAAHPDSVLAVGPVPVSGEDKIFPGGYTVRSEKAPNARGVRRALASMGEVLEADAFLQQASEGRFDALVLTGNYPSEWASNAVLAALERASFSVVIDTLPGKATEAADVVLPGATWLEKAGSFENVDHVAQHFEAAIPVIELAKHEGQIALDLAHTLAGRDRVLWNLDAVRSDMGDALGADLRVPEAGVALQSEIAYVEL